MNLKPLGDRVVVKPDTAEEKTSSGLYLTSGSQEKPQRGTVVAVGTGKRDEQGNYIPMEVKVGDVVVYGQFAGQEVKSEGEEYLILRSDDLFAVVNQ